MTEFLQKIQDMVQMLLISPYAKERNVLSSICYVCKHLPMAFDQYYRFYQFCLQHNKLCRYQNE